MHEFARARATDDSHHVICSDRRFDDIAMTNKKTEANTDDVDNTRGITHERTNRPTYSQHKANYPQTNGHDRDTVEETSTANAIRRMSYEPLE